MMMKNTIEMVRAELWHTAFMVFQLSRPHSAASTMAPAAPTAPASLGVAQPSRIESLMVPMRNTGGKNARQSSGKSLPSGTVSRSGGSGGASEGFSLAARKMNRRYIADSVRPGTIAAENRLPTETVRRSAITISMMLGGMRMPSVPAAAMVPQESAWL